MHCALKRIVFITLLILAAGCSAETKADPEEPLELPFAQRGEISEHSFRLIKNAPEYFRPYAWADDERVIGLSRDNITLLNTTNGTIEDLGVMAWEIWLAPHRKSVVFNNEAGLWFFTFNGQPVLRIPTLEEWRTPSGIIWGPDSNRLIYRLDDEWDSKHYLYCLDTEKQRELSATLDGYFMNRAVAWLQNDKVLFQAIGSRGQDGRSEYTEFGYRGDFAVFDLQNNSYKLITDVSDGWFMSFEGTLDEDAIVFILQHLEKGPKKWGVLDITGEFRQSSPVEPELLRVYLPEGDNGAYYFYQDGLIGDNARLRFSFGEAEGRNEISPLAHIYCEGGMFSFITSPDNRRALLHFPHREEQKDTDTYLTKEFLYLVSW